MERKATSLRISLRGLLVLSTIICLWFGKISIDARNQKQAVARIRELGGNFHYDWEEPIVDPASGNRSHPAGPAASQWLRSLVGDD